MIKSKIRGQAAVLALFTGMLCLTQVAKAADDIQERTIR